MSVKVDPFVIPIPDKWLRDPELTATVQYLWRFLYDLWRRTGGGSDQIANQQMRELYPWMSGLINDSHNAGSGLPSFTQHAQPESWKPEFKVCKEDSKQYNFASPGRFRQLPQFASGTAKAAFFSVSAGHTTAGSEIVEATSNITVTLNATPDADEIVTVKRNTGAGAVTVDGNGRNIDGSATYSLSTNYNTVTVIYSATSGIWLTI